MGQVIELQPRRTASHDRRADALKVLCAVTYVLGFFVAGPSLIVFGFAFAFGAQPVSALVCIGALMLVWAATKAAYSRL